MKYKVNKNNEIIQSAADKYVLGNVELKRKIKLIDTDDLGELYTSYIPTIVKNEKWGMPRYSWIESAVVDKNNDNLKEFIYKYRELLNKHIRRKLIENALEEDETKTSFMVYLTDPTNQEYAQYLENFNLMKVIKDKALAEYIDNFNALKNLVQ